MKVHELLRHVNGGEKSRDVSGDRSVSDYSGIEMYKYVGDNLVEESPSKDGQRIQSSTTPKQSEPPSMR